MKTKIILYYKYVTIENPQRILKEQRRLCESLNLKGRIILAHEGINGTLGGTVEEIEKYKNFMNSHELFKNIDFKESPGSADDFPRLRVVIKDEIVHLGIDTKEVTVKDGGKHLSPDEVHELLKENPDDLVILDTRNNYESRVGTFKGSLTPNIKTFRELPQYIDENKEKFKDKKVLMHCTGGVRCERATAYLNQKKIAKEIYQVNGGIHRYTEKYPDGYFRGKNYVFDNRVTVRINNDVLTDCDICKNPCDEYTNCINSLCNKHFISCETCIERLNNCCSETCSQKISTGATPIRKKPLPQPSVTA